MEKCSRQGICVQTWNKTQPRKVLGDGSMCCALVMVSFLEKIPDCINCEIAVCLLEIKCEDFYIIWRYVVNTHSWSWEFRSF